ncbi:hypothetical protein NDU88_003678 [Pleurodeles waltl]|uniref:Uncharacterized protein n=1 Tax=Pleurodeles waltl TaxID=8319 RepID=A0AAV7WSZ9_PLEWA|nr:hypothetical protein NDU88_003678 [Pleurodeles waltl]
MDALEGSQEHLESGTMAQAAGTRCEGKECGKPAPEVPAFQIYEAPIEDAPEPTGGGDNTAAQGIMLEVLGSQVNGPPRQEFCKAHKEFLTLEVLKWQAEALAAGDTSGGYLLYYENDLLYSEPKVLGVGQSMCWWSPSVTGSFHWGCLMISS